MSILALLLILGISLAAPPDTVAIPTNLTDVSIPTQVVYNGIIGAHVTVVNGTYNPISNSFCGVSIYKWTTGANPVRYVVSHHELYDRCEAVGAYDITAGTGDVPQACFIQSQPNGEVYYTRTANMGSGIDAPGDYYFEWQCGNTTFLTTGQNFTVVRPYFAVVDENAAPTYGSEVVNSYRLNNTDLNFKCRTKIVYGNDLVQDLGWIGSDSTGLFVVKFSTLGLNLFTNYEIQAGCDNYALLNQTFYPTMSVLNYDAAKGWSLFLNYLPYFVVACIALTMVGGFLFAGWFR